MCRNANTRIETPRIARAPWPRRRIRNAPIDTGGLWVWLEHAPQRAELRSGRFVDDGTRREHGLAAVRLHELEVPALVAITAVTVGVAGPHAIPDLRRARNAGATQRAQLVERAIGLRGAQPVVEPPVEEPDTGGLLGAGVVVAALDGAVALLAQPIPVGAAIGADDAIVA